MISRGFEQDAPPIAQHQIVNLLRIGLIPLIQPQCLPQVFSDDLEGEIDLITYDLRVAAGVGSDFSLPTCNMISAPAKGNLLTSCAQGWLMES